VRHGDEGYVVYFLVDTGDFKPFIVKRNDNEVVSAVNDLNALAEGPEPPPTDKAWQRQYCDLQRCRCK
jgi:hypothetical protein